jgi:hypothetical protein
MIFQCEFCLHHLHLVPGKATYCQCGAVYTVQMVTGNSTAMTMTVSKDYDALHRQAVPKAFYDAFSEKELQP